MGDQALNEVPRLQHIVCDDHAICVDGRCRVLHAAIHKTLHKDLNVFAPRVFHSRSLREVFHHVGDRLPHSIHARLGCFGGNPNAVFGAAKFFIRPPCNHDQIRRNVHPRIGFDFPIRWPRYRSRVFKAVIGVVPCRKPIPIVVLLPLSPDFSKGIGRARFAKMQPIPRRG